MEEEEVFTVRAPRGGNKNEVDPVTLLPEHSHRLTLPLIDRKRDPGNSLRVHVAKRAASDCKPSSIHYARNAKQYFSFLSSLLTMSPDLNKIFKYYLIREIRYNCNERII